MKIEHTSYFQAKQIDIARRKLVRDFGKLVSPFLYWVIKKLNRIITAKETL